MVERVQGQFVNACLDPLHGCPIHPLYFLDSLGGRANQVFQRPCLCLNSSQSPYSPCWIRAKPSSISAKSWPEKYSSPSRRLSKNSKKRLAAMLSVSGKASIRPCNCFLDTVFMKLFLRGNSITK